MQRRRRGAPSLLRGQTRLTSFATSTTTHDGQHSTRTRASVRSVRAHEHARTHTADTAFITFSPAAVERRELVDRVDTGEGPVGAAGFARAPPAQGGASRAQLKADGGRKADDPREAVKAKLGSRRAEGRRSACGTVRRRGCAQWRPPGRRFRLPTAALTRRRHAARRLERDCGGWTALLTVCMRLVLVLHQGQAAVSRASASRARASVCDRREKGGGDTVARYCIYLDEVRKGIYRGLPPGQEC